MSEEHEAIEQAAGMEEEAPGGVEEPSAGVEEPPDGEVELPLEAHVEAVLFIQDQPLPLTRIQSLFPDRTRREVEDVLRGLQGRYRDARAGIELREIAGGWQLFTRPEVDETLGRLTKAPGADKLSPAAIETLAIIAYRQPVIRADIEAVRGVQAGPLLRTLLEKRLIRIVGRSEVPGHPLLYGTAKRFLDHFGLRDLGELPKPEEVGEAAVEPVHEAPRQDAQAAAGETAGQDAQAAEDEPPPQDARAAEEPPPAIDPRGEGELPPQPFPTDSS